MTFTVYDTRVNACHLDRLPWSLKRNKEENSRELRTLLNCHICSGLQLHKRKLIWLKLGSVYLINQTKVDGKYGKVMSEPLHISLGKMFECSSLLSLINGPVFSVIVKIIPVGAFIFRLLLIITRNDFITKYLYYYILIRNEETFFYSQGEG